MTNELQPAPERYLALVIAYRDHGLVRTTLEQLAAQALSPERVLVVDNGGTLTEADLADLPLAERTELVPLPSNPGYGAAVNQAKGRLNGDALLVLTHDAVFGPELAEELLRVLRARVRAGAVAPVLRFANDPERLFSAGGRLSPGGRAAHWGRVLSDLPYRVDWLDGAIVMFDPAALEAIGWIAEQYFLYFEDVDTGWRLARAGFESVVVPSAEACQQPGAHPVYLGVRNMVLFARTAGIPALASAVAVLRRVGRESAGRLLRGRPPQLGAAWRGWRDGRRGISGPPSSSNPREKPIG